VGAFLGDRVWDQQARFRIRLGALPFSQFCEFLPCGAAIDALRDFVRFLAGQALAFDLQLVLQADEVPALRLSDEPLDGPRLGWTSWLKTEPFRTDASEAVFSYGS